jgi:hypothetical protein
MSRVIFSTTYGRLALLAVLGLAAHAGAGDEPARLKAAARAQVAKASPTVRLDHVEISRIVDGYAIVTVYPDMKKNPTDPAKVILHREGGIWKAIAGPGTAYPPGSRPAAPGALFELESPRPTSWVPAGESARKAIQRLNVGRKRFKNTRVTFQYPADAVVEAQRGEVRLVGPKVREPVFSGPAYEIAITPLATVLKGTLDEWGYTRMQEEVRKREAENGRGGPNTQPESATFFHLPKSDVFQIDWFAGDSTIREFYVVPKGGGRVVKIVTRVYPIQNNPAAPRAESAVNLVLQTLEPAPAAPRRRLAL